MNHHFEMENGTEKSQIIHRIYTVPVVYFGCLSNMVHPLRRFLVIFIWTFVPNFFIQEIDGRQIEILFDGRGKCPNEEKIIARFDGNITKTRLNWFSFNGSFIVDRDITADLVVSKK